MKICLKQTFGAHAGRSSEFDRDVITFGRLPSNDFAFDAYADLDASGSHAELRWRGGRWILQDLGSRNGTFVHGQRVESHEIADGDEIEFGVGGPRVRVELPQMVGAGTLAATPIVPGATPAPLAPSLAPSPSPPSAAAPPPSSAEDSGAVWRWVAFGGCALLVLVSTCLFCIFFGFILRHRG